LVGRPSAQRLELAHDAVAAVDRIGELVAVVPEALTDRIACPADDLVDARDRVGIADADDADIALADLAGPLELHAKLVRRDVSWAGDAGGALVELLVDAVAHIDVATEEVLIV